METIELVIPAMKRAHCQMTVTDVVNSIGGHVKGIAPAKAEIELTNNLTRNEVVEAIEMAGYVVVND